MDQEGEFENGMLVTVAASLSGAFASEMWGVSLTSDAATRTVDIHLAFSRELNRVDRYELEELLSMLDSQSVRVFWKTQIWVGARADVLDWPGLAHRRVYLQRSPDAEVPDDFD